MRGRARATWVRTRAIVWRAGIRRVTIRAEPIGGSVLFPGGPIWTAPRPQKDCAPPSSGQTHPRHSDSNMRSRTFAENPLRAERDVEARMAELVQPNARRRDRSRAGAFGVAAERAAH